MATSHFCGDHLAAVRQVGEGASLRRDALSTNAQARRLQVSQKFFDLAI
jgi:hypothetical protein